MSPCAAPTGAAWPAAAYWEGRARGEGLGKGPAGSGCFGGKRDRAVRVMVWGALCVGLAGGYWGLGLDS